MKLEDENFKEEFLKWLNSKTNKELVDSLKEFARSDNMSEEETLKYFKRLTNITKQDEIKNNMKIGVEITTDMAEQLLNLIQKQQKELEKKDKITNEMIVDIYKRTHIRTKECNFYVDKDKCLKYASCTECIFNYFERLVEGE